MKYDVCINIPSITTDNGGTWDLDSCGDTLEELIENAVLTERLDDGADGCQYDLTSLHPKCENGLAVTATSILIAFSLGIRGDYEV